MRMLKKSFMSACIALALVLLLPSVDVYANAAAETSQKTYTVTFRPGKVGKFKEDVVSTLKQTYGENNVEVTGLGAIKVTVVSGTNAPIIIAADVAVIPNENNEISYFAKSEEEWGTKGVAVDRNMDFVVDYGKLINGVEYTVEYVDSASGESIAPSKIAQANAKEDMTATAPSQIIVSGATVYNLSSASSMTLTLSEDASQNVFTFEYTLAPAGTVIEEVIIGEDGQIITLEEYMTTTVGGGAVAGGAAGGAGGAGAAGGGAAEGGEAAGGNEAVEILDEETPLAGGIEGGSNEEPAGMVEIGEEEVPLASGEEQMANMALIGASIFGAGAVALAGLWLYMKKKRVTAEVTSQEE